MTGSDSRPRKRSVRVAGHATSVTIEGEIWDLIGDIAATRGLSVAALITEIDAGREASLSSAIRVFVLDYVLKLSNARGP